MATAIERDDSERLTWSLSLVGAAIGATVLFDAMAGINWPIWVASASICLVVSRRVACKRVELPLTILVGWATLLSVGAALSNNGFLHFLIFLSVGMLLGLAVLSVGCSSWRQLSAKLLPGVPFLAPFRVWRAAAYRVAESPRAFASPRSRAIAKGVLLSAPLVVVLVALLGNADPVIRWATDRMGAWLPDWSFPQRVLFFLFVLSITLGANSIASRQISADLPRMPALGLRLTVGTTEQRMMLWSAAAVLWLFVALQLSYFVQPPPAAIGSGITFAEYARRGFGELSFAVTIVGAIILLLEHTRSADAPEKNRNTLRRLELALLVALELILLSAFRRVILYEEAYGFTISRIFAQAYMLAMALALVALALEVRREAISIAFGRRVAEIALGVLTVLIFWNSEAWIVNKNFDRTKQTGKFDLAYAVSLSNDAIPALLARRHELPPVSAQIEGLIRCEPTSVRRRWFEWNRSAAAAEDALRAAHPDPCPSGQSLRLSRHVDLPATVVAGDGR